MFCSACGAQLSQGARFCNQCGAAAHEDAVESTGALNPVDALVDSGPQSQVGSATGFAVLVVRRGPNEGTAFTLNPPVVHVGRAADQEVFLDDITVSRRHAELRFDGSAWTVVDLGSLNGTYVNKSPVQECALSSGDELQIGKYRFHFMAASGGQA